MTANQFIALIRLPFPRGNFLDPPQADWNATKDRALWKVISKSSKTSDLNWVELATRFQVPPPFLLQQAAWLYERHLEHVRSQMKKVGGVNTPAISNLATSQAVVGGIPMRRVGSGGSGPSRTPSALSVRPKEPPAPRAETSTPVPPLSRTPSTNTITQSKTNPPHVPSRTSLPRSTQPLLGSPKSPVQAGPMSSFSHASYKEVDPESPDDPEPFSSSSSTSDSDAENPAHRSQLFKRPPRFRSQRTRESDAYDDALDEGDEAESGNNASLPFAHATGTAQLKSDSKQTSRTSSSLKRGHYVQPESSRAQSKKVFGQPKQAAQRIEGSSSMASSASDAPKAVARSPGPLSPKHRAELAKLSPRRAMSRKDGSEGTPSMGSSFSDIDDASISQSALEEALLSNIQHGRMSTLSQLRSRYL
ncbi:hypothetical protein BS50DRAFT_619003 [Corynespora cassiicola Philippines]|uniref:Autophagy-related protein 29 n=1 Tax=Corynespora cassiicola Philippines TaxID=1448308 RepID=A0A2T2NXC8_CORCC|nr:hypothetical protein BS50DRAFT_619003 [Corynespora cassiicola Philippines]